MTKEKKCSLKEIMNKDKTSQIIKLFRDTKYIDPARSLIYAKYIYIDFNNLRFQWEFEDDQLCEIEYVNKHYNVVNEDDLLSAEYPNEIQQYFLQTKQKRIKDEIDLALYNMGYNIET
mgnify:CR=1 FL=1